MSSTLHMVALKPLYRESKATKLVLAAIASLMYTVVHVNQPTATRKNSPRNIIL